MGVRVEGMEDPKGWVAFLRKEGRVVRDAPLSFAVAVVASGLAIWALMDWGYSRAIQSAVVAREAIIETTAATLQQKQATIDHFQALLEQGIPSVTEQMSVDENAPENAYVFTERGNVYNLTRGVLQGYVIAINNNTETHARITEWRVGITVSETPPPNDLNEFGEMPRQDGVAVIRPGGIIPAYRNHRKLTDAETEAVKSGAKRIYVFGEIKYEDPAGNEHFTKFCHIYYGPETSNQFDGYLGSQANYCDAPHNDAR